MNVVTLTAQQKVLWLDTPIEALLLPELEPVGRWGRVIHELLLERAPGQLMSLAATDTLRSFILSEQARLSSVAQVLEDSWKRANPLPAPASYFDLVAWHNNAKSYASECVAAQIGESFV